AIVALALAAVCPFTTIYAVTILTEVPTNFFVVAMCLAATLAFRNSFTTEDTEGSLKDQKNFKHALCWWSIAGLLGGIAVMLRPDCGLFVAAIGFTLVITTIWSVVRKARNRFGLEPGLRSWVFGLGQRPKAHFRAQLKKIHRARPDVRHALLSRIRARTHPLDDSQLARLSFISAVGASQRRDARRVHSAWLPALGENLVR